MSSKPVCPMKSVVLPFQNLCHFSFAINKGTYSSFMKIGREECKPELAVYRTTTRNYRVINGGYEQAGGIFSAQKSGGVNSSCHCILQFAPFPKWFAFPWRTRQPPGGSRLQKAGSACPILVMGCLAGSFCVITETRSGCSNSSYTWESKFDRTNLAGFEEYLMKESYSLNALY